ncbi:AP3M1 [Symbiodinium natans]|uniref:Palmitoyltransferase n=1 Tax=Symbiodinium natans TaxID=878477 RepID=A0A812Q325_9DINO|nr:AP3M1 [Symbiodinium natans]
MIDSLFVISSSGNYLVERKNVLIHVVRVRGHESSDRLAKNRALMIAAVIEIIREVLQAWRDMARTVDSVARAGQSLFHIGMRLLGPCLVIMALVLKGFVTCTFFWHALPIMQDRAGLIGSSLLSFVGVFLLLNALYNYYKAVFTSAGLPPEFEKAKVSLVESSENPEVVPRKCPKCALLKPPRAHHCSVCGVCVMKMDHHCPWINNCVGFGNYRYFCLFLLFLGMACFFVVCVFGVFFHDVIFSWSRQGTRAFRQCILTSFMICASILAAVCFLGGFHTFLVMTNQTTIEFQINMMKRRESRYNGEFFRNPYDMGRSRNCQEVFGASALFVLEEMLLLFSFIAMSVAHMRRFAFAKNCKLDLHCFTLDRMLFLAVVSHEAAGAAVPQRWLPRLFLSHYSLGRNHRLPCSSCWIESTRLFIAIRPQALSHAKDSNIRSTCSFNSGYAYAVKVLFRYLGEVSEDALYLLLDEMIDSGLPFTTELNSLESIIAPPSAIGKVVQAVSGSSTQVLSDVPLESAGQAGPLGALSSALGALSHSQIGGASAEVWWRKQNVAYGSNEVYVDIVETISCTCNGSGNIVSGGISGEILMTSKLSGIPEVLLSLRNPSILQNVSFHPCVKLPRYQRDKVLSFIPPDGEFSLANYWIPDITMNLPFHFSVSVNYHSDHGKVQIAASPKLAVTMQHKQMLIDKFVVNVRLPASIASANLACQGGSVRFDEESKVIVWNLGKLASQESKAEGTLTYATNPKDGSVQIPNEEKSTAQLAFQIKGWAISGIRLDACDVTSINYTPYKASRHEVQQHPITCWTTAQFSLPPKQVVLRQSCTGLLKPGWRYVTHLCLPLSSIFFVRRLSVRRCS